MENRLNELKASLSIDINQLHIDAENQPVLMAEIGEIAAEAKAAAKRKKAELDEMKSALSLSVRSNPDTYGLTKATEASIASTVDIHDDVKNLKYECIELERHADLCKAIENAYHHRKSMIQSEVQLFVSNYWGEINVKEPNTGDMEDRVEKYRRKKAKQ